MLPPLNSISFVARPGRPSARSVKPSQAEPLPDMVSIRFGAEKPSRPPLPWPEVPDEMATWIKRQVADYETKKATDPSHRRYPMEDLTKVLNHPDIQVQSGLSENDALIHRIFGGLPLDTLCEMYGLDKLARDPDPSVEIPGVAQLTFRRNYGNEGARECLAKAIGAIRDDDLKSHWIDLMANDPYVHAQSAATRQIATFSTQERIDAKADELSSLAQREIPKNTVFGLPYHGALTGLSDSLKAVSPRLRWQLINQLLPMTRYNGDLHLETVVESYAQGENPKTDPTVLMLKAWLGDAKAVRDIEALLAGYDFEHHIQPYDRPGHDFTTNRHGQVARKIRENLSLLNNQVLKTLWVEQMSQWATEPASARSALGQDVLAAMAFFEAARDVPDPADPGKTRTWRDQMEVAIDQASEYSQPFLERWKVYHLKEQDRDFRFSQQRSETVLNQWTPEKIAAFEAAL